MKEPVVSVIIPVYNCEKYVSRAIVSVANQPCSDFLEILVVDDGSKDRTAQVCDETAKNYDNVKVFHKENGGVSSARNFAMDLAKGKYIAFLDADDWWQKNFFDEELKNEMAEGQTDVFQFSYKTASWNCKFQKENHVKEENLVFNENGRWRYDGSYFCNFIYKTELILKNNLTFPFIKIGEDQIFAESVLFFSRSLKKKDKAIFTYWSNKDSCVHTLGVKNSFNERYKGLEFLKSWYAEHGCDIEIDYSVFIIFHEMIYEFCAFNKWSAVEKEILADERLNIIKDYAKYPLWAHLEKCAKEWTKNPKRFWRKCRLFVRPKLKAKAFLYAHPKLRGTFDYFFYKYKMRYETVDPKKTAEFDV